MILDEGVWDMPRLYDGRPELQKPPLYYWLVAFVARMRHADVDAVAVRLPAAGAALLCVLAVGIGLEYGRRRARRDFWRGWCWRRRCISHGWPASDELTCR